jgi:hypothetical protein
MADATRIIVRKQDEATVVAEQLIDADTDTIIFAIPKGAVFSQSLNNFKLLKREGSVLGKEIIIESEDPLAQEKAVKAGLEVGEAPAAPEEDEAEEESEVEEEVATRGVSLKLPRGRSLRVKEPEVEEEEEPVKRIARGSSKKKAPIVEAERVIDAEVEEVVQEQRGEPTRPERKRSPIVNRKRAIVTTVVMLVVAAVASIGVFVLPKADIEVEMKKVKWEFSESIVVDKGISKVDVAGGKIPGQIFTQKNVVTSKLPATGAEFVERKATGVLTVYNAYSSQPQNIVATTRFITSSGVVFRTTKELTIPGAKIENSKIIASSITVPVVADKAGVAGNVGPTAHLTIPGFSKTPKFNGFYGELKEGTTGGFSGKTKVATASDIKAAKAEGSKEAEQLVRAQIAGQIPNGFRSVDGSSRFSITKQTAQQIADTEGNFTVTTEAQLSVFAFQEQDVKDFLTAKMVLATAGNGDFQVDSETLKYGSLSATTIIALGGKLSMPINYSAALSHKLDVEALRSAVAGKPESQLNSLILNTPGVTGGTVNLWPFYVGTVPSRVSKITIVVK